MYTVLNTPAALVKASGARVKASDDSTQGAFVGRKYKVADAARTTYLEPCGSHELNSSKSLGEPLYRNLALYVLHVSKAQTQ